MSDAGFVVPDPPLAVVADSTKPADRFLLRDLRGRYLTSA
jgi:hypothetical protein